MTREQAEECIGWEYPDAYNFCNTPVQEQAKEINEYDRHCGQWRAALNDAGELEGMCVFSMLPNETVEIGLGLRPDLTGKGLGLEFVRHCVHACRQQEASPFDPIVLRVHEANERAIKVYRRAGFRELAAEEDLSSGMPEQYIRMQLDGIELREFGAECLEDVKRIYREEGWRAYLTDDGRLAAAFRNSLYTLGAFEGDRLIGFVRCVGDGGHVVLIQDVIVGAAYRREGIGSILVEEVLEKYGSVRTITLLTDEADEVCRCFYRSLGFSPAGDKGMASYIR